MNDNALQNYLAENLEIFRGYKSLAEKALAQVSDEEFFRRIDEESNSLAIIVKHSGGNLLSRWTNFLTTDGEKPERNRDGEFLLESETREVILAKWEAGWTKLFDTLSSLKTEDLAKTVKIRGEDFSVTSAISRSLSHTAYHIGQITFLAKHFRSTDWQNLSIPRNQSSEFNKFLAENQSKENYLESAGRFAEREKSEN